MPKDKRQKNKKADMVSEEDVSFVEGLQENASSIRNVVEGIFVAIVVALVLRAFLVEAFVIPTGSMAVSLLGRHHDIECSSCALLYPVSKVSGNESPRTKCPNCGQVDNFVHNIECSSCALLYPVSKGIMDESPKIKCPSCGQADNFDTGWTEGDRVIVLKYFYRFTEPKPWDVIVFYNPNNCTQNYIKRLIGVPGDQIQIVNGDVFCRQSDDAPWVIRRKPDHVQDAVWRPVYNMDIVALNRDQRRWVPSADSPEKQWDVKERKLVFEGSTSFQELKFETSNSIFGERSSYNHLDNIENTGVTGDGSGSGKCTDLRIDGVVRLSKESRDACLEMRLYGYGKQYKMQMKSSGDVKLMCAVGDKWQDCGQASVDPLIAGEGRKVSLRQIDYLIQVLVDDELVLSCDEGNLFDVYAEACRRHEMGDEGEARGVTIAGRGEAFELFHLNIYKDLYYTKTLKRDSPAIQGIYGKPIKLRKDENNPEIDEFFCLGDNSYTSHDGRCWGIEGTGSLLRTDDYKQGTVPRYNLIGKAVMVYWPSGFGLLPNMRRRIVPNAGEMRLIR